MVDPCCEDSAFKNNSQEANFTASLSKLEISHTNAFHSSIRLKFVPSRPVLPPNPNPFSTWQEATKDTARPIKYKDPSSQFVTYNPKPFYNPLGSKSLCNHSSIHQFHSPRSLLSTSICNQRYTTYSHLES